MLRHVEAPTDQLAPAHLSGRAYVRQAVGDEISTPEEERPGESSSSRYLLVEDLHGEGAEPERSALALFASRFSLSVLLAAVFEFFEPPLSLPAIPASLVSEDPQTCSLL